METTLYYVGRLKNMPPLTSKVRAHMRNFTQH